MYCQRCGNPLAAGARFCNACGTPVPGGGAATVAATNKNSGVAAIVIAVIVLFGIIAFIGIVAAIAIPNMLTAQQRAMQRRTVATMELVTRTGVQKYRDTHENALPDSIGTWKDAWGHDLRYTSDGTNYWIVSAGKDGAFEEDDPSRYTAASTTGFDADLVEKNGELLRAPDDMRVGFKP
jgi:type II secretory pathway pseudopilin PulG